MYARTVFWADMDSRLRGNDAALGIREVPGLLRFARNDAGWDSENTL